MAKKTKKSSKRPAKSKSKKTLSVILTILVIILFAAWYLFGKPYIVPDEQGFMVVMTEEPIIQIGTSEAPSTGSGTAESNEALREPQGPQTVQEQQQVAGQNKNISSQAADLGQRPSSKVRIAQTDGIA